MLLIQTTQTAIDGIRWVFAMFTTSDTWRRRWKGCVVAGTTTVAPTEYRRQRRVLVGMMSSTWHVFLFTEHFFCVGAKRFTQEYSRF